jgi:uncharacterized membrane protein
MERPIIEIPVTESDTRIERICRVAILLLWLGTLLCYFYVLPNTIPIHYNLKNEPDGFGSKAYIFITPGIATALYILLSFVGRYPHRFNYLKPVTEENAERMYTSAVRLLRVAKMYIILGFFFQTANDILSLKYSSFHSSFLSIMLEWAPVILVVAGVVAYMLDERRLRNKQQ